MGPQSAFDRFAPELAANKPAILAELSQTPHPEPRIILHAHLNFHHFADARKWRGCKCQSGHFHG
jgi:hypothetical protein